jgi:uncharacterized protein YlxW (UPF0749 family)
MSAARRGSRTGVVLVAGLSLAFGFLIAAQVRVQLLIPSNRIERNQALVHSVRDLERTNDVDRRRVEQLRAEIQGLETQASQRSDAARRLNDQLAELRAHAGLVPLRGPGVTVTISDGRPDPGRPGSTGYLVTFEDVQDVVNSLFEGGAEGIAVNGRRLSPVSSFTGSRDTVEIDQGPPLVPPFRISAVGNRSGMEQLMADPTSLADLRLRQRTFFVGIAVDGSTDLFLRAYDSSLNPTYARPA